ncbi:MAG TPA: ADP-ribosylglycohydrolase family protein [Bacillota bacterium]|nr:ADP-ribosylglycohydrolase family protein [Bacillota bacterium]
MKRKPEYFRGCLLGGALGDALGWPVEFLQYNEIMDKYGPQGIQDLVCTGPGLAQITDDTQMTLFTAEGILRAEAGRAQNVGCPEPGVDCQTNAIVFHAYQRWLLTQGYPANPRIKDVYDGWLLGVKALYDRRGPGNTCLSALSSGKQGTIREPINDSKGCGGVMRVAPVGLFYPKERAFDKAAEFAAITHGHPSGYLSAGALAYLIAALIEGQELETAIQNTQRELATHKHHEECTRSMQQALELARSNLPDEQAIRQLGEGWVGEEALGIAVYCALKHQRDFRRALITAVNHDGDSDSTGAITGNILGACLGLDQLPADWLEKLEFSEVLVQLAGDLLTGYQDSQEWRERYPGH